MEDTFLDFGFTIIECFDDCQLNMFLYAHDGKNAPELKTFAYSRKFLPVWLYFCASLDKSTGNVKFYLDNDTTISYSLENNIFQHFNGALEIRFQQWDNPGKLSLFNVYSNVSKFVECGSDVSNKPNTWNAEEWSIEQGYPDLINIKVSFLDEICENQKLLFMQSPSTWDVAEDVSTALGGQVVSHALKAPISVQKWLANFLEKGMFFWSGEVEISENRNFEWCQGYPIRKVGKLYVNCLFGPCDGALCKPLCCRELNKSTKMPAILAFNDTYFILRFVFQKNQFLLFMYIGTIEVSQTLILQIMFV